VHVSVHAGEKIRIEESYKYSPAQAQELWQASNVIEGASWTNHGGSYSKFYLHNFKLFCKVLRIPIQKKS
jgi:uncharacterized SAM-dependent methyltransferase